MNKKYKKIFNVKPLKSDKEKWGLFPIRRIEGGFALNDDSELPELRRFIKDEIKYLECEIRHFRKWSPRIYHKNTYVSRMLGKRTLEIILKRLINVKKINLK